MMSTTFNLRRLFAVMFAFLLMTMSTSLISAQVSTNQTPNNTDLRSVPSGSRMKFRGVVIERNGDMFTVRDRNRADYSVVINSRTSIKTHGGFLRGGKSYPADELLRGLIVEVEGRGDAQGNLLAEKVRFDESDMRAAITSDTRVSPVEENQRKMAGQMDELYAVAAEARQEVTKVNERVNALDDYDQQAGVAVTFRVNSAVLSAEAKAATR